MRKNVDRFNQLSDTNIIPIMSQLKYDVSEFIIHNKSEILTFLDVSTCHLLECKDTFQDNPEIFQSLILKAKVRQLIKYVQEHFNINSEELLLMFDDEFVKITLDL